MSDMQALADLGHFLVYKHRPPTDSRGKLHVNDLRLVVGKCLPLCHSLPEDHAPAPHSWAKCCMPKAPQQCHRKLLGLDAELDTRYEIDHCASIAPMLTGVAALPFDTRGLRCIYL